MWSLVSMLDTSDVFNNKWLGVHFQYHLQRETLLTVFYMWSYMWISHKTCMKDYHRRVPDSNWSFSVNVYYVWESDFKGLSTSRQL